MSRPSWFALCLLLAGCSAAGRGSPAHPIGAGGASGTDGGGAGGGNLTGCDPSQSRPDDDQDHDGYTVAAGDCNDCNPSINPGAIQIAGDPTDYACNGMPGVVPACDQANTGKNDPVSLAQAFEQCDPRFFRGAMLVGPSDPRARLVKAGFGSIRPRQGANLALLSNGLALDKSDAGFVEPKGGTALGCDNQFPNPLPTIPANPLCAAELMGMSCQPATVNDYTELVVKLKAPTNASSFSFDFQFFSAEYPDFVCTQFNDEFLVLQESPGEFASPANISFDASKNPITVNNGLFTVCQNGTRPYDMSCKQPVTQLAGTGYEDPVSMGVMPPADASCADDGQGPCGMLMSGGDQTSDLTRPMGGSTGWLTTTSPVTGGEEVTLHFIIFDEGDHILDSTVVIDNFRWGAASVPSPTTGPIL